MENGIDWAKGSIEEYKLAIKIAQRAKKFTAFKNVSFMSIHMDIIATHICGCKLKLKNLLEAKNSDFLHDVCGIHDYINHETGKLENCFLPRYAC